MPHFILDCSENVKVLKSATEILNKVHNTAFATGLFKAEGPGGIKVRLNTYTDYLTVGEKQDFIHVFANIMEGRTAEQKENLSRQVVRSLKDMFPEMPIISMNIRDFEKDSYCNKTMV